MTNSIPTLSDATVFALYRKISQIARDLNDVRWQLVQPIDQKLIESYWGSAREDLRNELQECITQAQIALDNLK